MKLLQFLNENKLFTLMLFGFFFIIYIIERIYVCRLLKKGILKAGMNFGIIKRTWDFLISRTPWYFTIIIGLIVLNSVLLLILENMSSVFVETYKYLVGALVGALIGGRGIPKSSSANDQ